MHLQVPGEMVVEGLRLVLIHSVSPKQDCHSTQNTDPSQEKSATCLIFLYPPVDFQRRDVASSPTPVPWHFYISLIY